jgi:CheY-like chemotaxis protein
MTDSKRTPLVVHIDDEHDITALIQAALIPLGVEVVYACDGPTGLSVIEKRTPDLVLLDIRMPGVSGLEVCEKIKQNPRFKEIPVLMLTAMTQMKDVETAVSKGADGYVVKPIDLPKLRQRICEMLSLPLPKPGAF